MDPLIEQEYTFNIYSARYGHFLVDVYTAYPEVLVSKSGSSIKIRVPQETATLLKLKYGDSLVKKNIVSGDQIKMLITLLEKEQKYPYNDEDLITYWEKDEDDEC